MSHYVAKYEVSIPLESRVLTIKSIDKDKCRFNNFTPKLLKECKVGDTLIISTKLEFINTKKAAEYTVKHNRFGTIETTQGRLASAIAGFEFE